MIKGVIIEEIFEQRNEYVNSLREKLNDSNRLYIFGAGRIGLDVYKILNKWGISIQGFIDNDQKKWGENIEGNIKCISLSEVGAPQENDVILLTMAFYDNVYQQLNALGFEKVYNFSEYKIKYLQLFEDEQKSKHALTMLRHAIGCFEEEKSKKIMMEILKNWFNVNIKELTYPLFKGKLQYFDCEFVEINENEVFLDVGAYDGDSISSFLSVSNFKFQQIYAFELEKQIYARLERNIARLSDEVKSKIKAFNIGLWDKNKNIRYSSLDVGSKIGLDDGEEGKVVALDTFLPDVIPTYIKMDIEGAEMKALEGCKNIIKKHKPKLAICVYHEPEDLWQISLFLKKLVPEYKLYLRHYSNLEYETVCYAVI